jgi:hypothetical protein
LSIYALATVIIVSELKSCWYLKGFTYKNWLGDTAIGGGKPAAKAPSMRVQRTRPALCIVRDGCVVFRIVQHDPLRVTFDEWSAAKLV